MARPLRIEFPGAWYHVMNRGQARRNIFLHDEHRKYFLSLLATANERYQADIHAYCLMDNHYHIILHTPTGNLQRIMRHINGVYTQYFNRTEGLDGPLFRGRYKAILVDANAYWLELSRYIHRNPLEANIIKNLNGYKWSSYCAYVNKTKKPAWLATDFILNALCNSNNRYENYQSFTAKEASDTLHKFYMHKKLLPLFYAEPLLLLLRH